MKFRRRIADGYPDYISANEFCFFALHVDCCNESPLKRDWSIVFTKQTESRTLLMTKSLSLTASASICRYMFIDMTTSGNTGNDAFFFISMNGNQCSYSFMCAG